MTLVSPTRPRCLMLLGSTCLNSQKHSFSGCINICLCCRLPQTGFWLYKDTEVWWDCCSVVALLHGKFLWSVKFLKRFHLSSSHRLLVLGLISIYLAKFRILRQSEKQTGRILANHISKTNNITTCWWTYSSHNCWLLIPGMLLMFSLCPSFPVMTYASTLGCLVRLPAHLTP